MVSQMPGRFQGSCFSVEMAVNSGLHADQSRPSAAAWRVARSWFAFTTQLTDKSRFATATHLIGYFYICRRLIILNTANCSQFGVGKIASANDSRWRRRHISKF